MEINMKKILIVLSFVATFSGIAVGSKGFLSREEFIPLEKAEKKYGTAPFDPVKFKKADQKTKASMVVALIKSKRYLGKPLSLVREELGEWDGYFETDSIPAYLIESSATGSKEAWEILFLPDKSGRNVGEIRIHKNCC